LPLYRNAKVTVVGIALGVQVRLGRRHFKFFCQIVADNAL
jgi:hypothetical protein